MRFPRSKAIIFGVAGALLLIFFTNSIATWLTDIFTSQLIGEVSHSKGEGLLLSAGYHFERDHFRTVIRLCEKLLDDHSKQLQPAELRRAFAMLAMSYGKVGQVKQELQTYQRLMDFDPSYALFLQGISLYDQGRHEEAKHYLERAVVAQGSGIPLEKSDLDILQGILRR